MKSSVCCCRCFFLTLLQLLYFHLRAMKSLFLVGLLEVNFFYVWLDRSHGHIGITLVHKVDKFCPCFIVCMITEKILSPSILWSLVVGKLSLCVLARRGEGPSSDEESVKMSYFSKKFEIKVKVDMLQVYSEVYQRFLRIPSQRPFRFLRPRRCNYVP